MNFIFAFLFINALVAIQLCGGQNSTTGTEGQTDDATSTEKTALQKGMDPIFDLYHNFLDTVMPNNFYDDADSPFSKLLLTCEKLLIMGWSLTSLPAFYELDLPIYSCVITYNAFYRMTNNNTIIII